MAMLAWVWLAKFRHCVVCAVSIPTCVVCVLAGDGEGDAAGQRDIQVQFRDGLLQPLSDLHAAYDPLHFVLFHPHAEPGWHVDLKQGVALSRCT